MEALGTGGARAGDPRVRAIIGWLAILALALSPGPAAALDDGALETARALLATYQEDPAKLERARDMLAAAVQGDPAPAAALILLARTWFLIGEIRARTDDERLAAYERGRDAGRRAVEAAAQSAEAHLWYAINLGRWAEAKGFLRAATAVSTVKDEVETVLRLDPRSVEGHALAGSLARDLPGFLGGSPARAEEEFRRALDLDSHRGGVRVELARLYIKVKRYTDARRELQQALEERAPSDLPYWTLRVEPQARALLESIRDKP